MYSYVPFMQSGVLVCGKIDRSAKVPIVLFKSLKNSKRCSKGNFTSNFNLNKIKFCVGGGQHYLVLNKISTL